LFDKSTNGFNHRKNSVKQRNIIDQRRGRFSLAHVSPEKVKTLEAQTEQRITSNDVKAAAILGDQIPDSSI
jgi:hypothetical protein